MLGTPTRSRRCSPARRTSCMPGEAQRILRPILGDRSVLLLDGREHLRQRKLLLPPFHGDADAALRRSDARDRRARDRRLARRRSRSQLAPRMQAVTLEIILRAVFGVREAAAARRAARRPARAAGFRRPTRACSSRARSSASTARSKLAVFREHVEAVDKLIDEEIARAPRSRRPRTSATTSSRCCCRPRTRTASR